MIKKVCLGILILTACAPARMISPLDFQAIPLGAEMIKIEEQFGPPFDTCPITDDFQEYRYIQRIDVGSDVTEQIEYVFIVRNGRIIDKRRQEMRCAFNKPIE